MEASQEASRRPRRPITLAGRARWRGRLLAPGIALALGACSGGAGGGPAFVDPDTVTFDYGASSDASWTPVVDTISERVADARAEMTTPGDVDASWAFEMARLPLDVAGEALYGSAPSALRAGAAGSSPGAVSGTWPDCVTATASQVRYLGCHGASVSADGSVTSDLDGTFTRAGTTLAWDMTMRWEAEGASGDFGKYSWHLIGALVVGAREVSGQVLADLTLCARTAATGELHSAYTEATDLALGLDLGGCPSGGTVEVKLLAAETSLGGREASSGLDRGALLDWTACRAVSMTLSTP